MNVYLYPWTGGREVSSRLAAYSPELLMIMIMIMMMMMMMMMIIIIIIIIIIL